MLVEIKIKFPSNTVASCHDCDDDDFTCTVFVNKIIHDIKQSNKFPAKSDLIAHSIKWKVAVGKALDTAHLQIYYYYLLFIIILLSIILIKAVMSRSGTPKLGYKSPMFYTHSCTGLQ